MEIEPAYLAATFTLSLGAIASALISFGELREHKRNIKEKVDSNKKDSDEKANHNFYLVKDELAAHEARDDTRHKELIERIGNAEEHILEVIKAK